jgi:hypothetical protein
MEFYFWEIDWKFWGLFRLFGLLKIQFHLGSFWASFQSHQTRKTDGEIRWVDEAFALMLASVTSLMLTLFPPGNWTAIEFNLKLKLELTSTASFVLNFPEIPAINFHSHPSPLEPSIKSFNINTHQKIHRDFYSTFTTQKNCLLNTVKSNHAIIYHGGNVCQRCRVWRESLERNSIEASHSAAFSLPVIVCLAGEKLMILIALNPIPRALEGKKIACRDPFAEEEEEFG